MSDVNDIDSTTLARIDERTQAHTASFNLHIKEDSERFDKILNFVSKGFDKMDARFDKSDDKMSTLWDEKNERKGAFSLANVLVGGVWAAIVLIIGYFIPKG